MRRPRIFYGWYIVLAGFMGNMGGMAVAGVVIHEFSVLTDRGLSAVIATAVLATHSFGSVISRVLWGRLADRFPVRYLMGGVFLGSAVGLVILLSVRTAPSPRAIVSRTEKLATTEIGDDIWQARDCSFARP